METIYSVQLSAAMATEWQLENKADRLTDTAAWPVSDLSKMLPAAAQFRVCFWHNTTTLEAFDTIQLHWRPLTQYNYTGGLWRNTTTLETFTVKLNLPVHDAINYSNGLNIGNDNLLLRVNCAPDKQYLVYVRNFELQVAAFCFWQRSTSKDHHIKYECMLDC